jgi:hypothetical protein
LYLNLGGDRFREAARPAGVREGGWGWGVAAVDLDHDGRLDLATTTGWDEPNGAGAMEWDRQQTYLFHNLGGLAGEPRFAEVALSAGLDHRGQGRALVHLDYDNDGDQDLLIFNHGTGPSLFRNDRPPGAHWLKVGLDTVASPALAPGGWGARVRVRSPAGEQLRVVGTGGYFGTSELGAHFGLGAEPLETVAVRVEWPNGMLSDWSDVAVDHALVIAAPAR